MLLSEPSSFSLMSQANHLPVYGIKNVQHLIATGAGFEIIF